MGPCAGWDVAEDGAIHRMDDFLHRAISREDLQITALGHFNSSFELCTFAPALFQSTSVLLEATKSTLAESIWKMVQCQQTDIPKDVQYMLDVMETF